MSTLAQRHAYTYPAGLPGFKGLVENLYRLNGTVFYDNERDVFKRGQFDATLDLLERRLPCQRLAVRSKLAQKLKPKIRRKGAIDTQAALLRLARNRDGALRLVTTNFDRTFHVAAKRTSLFFNTYEAPNRFFLSTMAGGCSIPTRLGIITRFARLTFRYFLTAMHQLLIQHTAANFIALHVAINPLMTNRMTDDFAHASSLFRIHFCVRPNSTAVIVSAETPYFAAIHRRVNDFVCTTSDN